MERDYISQLIILIPIKNPLNITSIIMINMVRIDLWRQLLE